VALASGDTKDQIADKITAAVNAMTDLPVTAASTGAGSSKASTVTARHNGEEGNYIDLRANYYQGEKRPNGLSLTITAMHDGATNPVLATAIAAIGDTQYHTIVMPWLDATNLTALATELESRWGPLIAKEGQAFAGTTRTLANSETLTLSRNEKLLSILCLGASPTPPYEIAAAVAGVRALSVSADPGRPYQTLPVPGVLPPAIQYQFDATERGILLSDGGSTLTCVAGAVYIERLITTYRLNGQGVADPAYRNVETIDVLAALRYTLRVRIALKYPRHKLAGDGTLFDAGQAVVTPKMIRAECCAIFREWESAGWVEDFEQFKKDLVVQRSGSDPDRVDAIIPPNCINQFRVFAAQVQFRQ
jgi:phage tail sheath gpL-like